MSGRVVVIEWPNIPPAELRGNSKLSREAQYSWKRKLREAGYWAAVEAVGANFDPPMERAEITIDYHCPRPIDFVNFARGYKAFEDGLLAPKGSDYRYNIYRANILLDDSPKVIQSMTLRWHKSKRGEQKTVIEIREVE